MTQQKSLKVNEASKVLCRQSDDLCRAAKVVRLKSKHAREASAAQRLLRKNYSAFKETLNPMKLKIFLDTESYRCLTSCLSIAARTRTAILTAVLLGNTRVIDCGRRRSSRSFVGNAKRVFRCRSQDYRSNKPRWAD